MLAAGVTGREHPGHPGRGQVPGMHPVLEQPMPPIHRPALQILRSQSHDRDRRRHPGGTEQHGYRCGVRGDVEERSPGTATAVTLRARLGQSHAVPTGLGLPTGPASRQGPASRPCQASRGPRPPTARLIDDTYQKGGTGRRPTWPGRVWDVAQPAPGGNGTSTDLARAERDVGQRARGRPRCRDTRRQAPPGRPRRPRLTCRRGASASPAGAGWDRSPTDRADRPAWHRRRTRTHPCRNRPRPSSRPRPARVRPWPGSWTWTS